MPVLDDKERKIVSKTSSTETNVIHLGCLGAILVVAIAIALLAWAGIAINNAVIDARIEKKRNISKTEQQLHDSQIILDYYEKVIFVKYCPCAGEAKAKNELPLLEDFEEAGKIKGSNTYHELILPKELQELPKPEKIK